MNTILLNKFAEFLEKQDMLSKLTENEKLHKFGYSDIHTVAAIGDMVNPNVTEIARHLNMTRGAVSKITKRLILAGLIEPYTVAENKQKIFFRLTKMGEEIYAEHEHRHKLWMERDNQFLCRFSDQQLEEISAFMDSFNHYLEERIMEFGGKENAD